MTADHGGSLPDLYGMLGVDRAATHEEIVRAWRRRARAEHPDSRPSDAAAPARFRALAEAYEVLSDPARRAAYDHATGDWLRRRTAAPDGPPVRLGFTGGAVTPAARVPEAPLRAGPVWVQALSQDPGRGLPADDEAGMTDLALLRYLVDGWGWPW